MRKEEGEEWSGKIRVLEARGYVIKTGMKGALCCRKEGDGFLQTGQGVGTGAVGHGRVQ